MRQAYSINPSTVAQELQPVIIQLNQSFEKVSARLDQMDGTHGTPKLYSAMSANNKQINLLADPSSPQDALNKRTADRLYLSASGGNGVISFNGRTGVVLPQFGDYPPLLGGTGQRYWAKGSILVGSGLNRTDLLAVGSDGSFLMANSGSTDGLLWQVVLGIGTRTAMPAQPQPKGIFYFQTDTAWTYYSTGSAWKYLGGINRNTRSARVGLTVSANDNNALWYESDTGWIYEMIGGVWDYISGVDLNTDAARTGLTIGANDNGAVFYATDTNVWWEVQSGAWAKIPVSLSAGVTGTLPVANGGTGGTSLTDGARIKNFRQSTGSIGASTTADVNITWTTPFADGNYTVQVSVQGTASASANDLRIHHWRYQATAANGIVVTVVNDDAGSAHTSTLHATAVHD